MEEVKICDLVAGPYQQQKSVDTDMTFDPAMEDVKRFCLEQQEVDLRMAASHFADISSDDLSRQDSRLQVGYELFCGRSRIDSLEIGQARAGGLDGSIAAGHLSSSCLMEC